MAKELMKGFPKHGEKYNEKKKEEDESELDLEDTEDEEDVEEEEEEEKIPPGESVEERLARLEGENASMRALIGKTRAPEPKKEEEEPEPDWEKLMYDDPKGFVGALSGQIVKQVSTELGSRYQKDQGEKEFWTEFYEDHDDLKQDKDLVKAVLSGNLNILGDMPVSQAKKKLADLTRERIMRYTGKREKDGKGKDKARVEGARSPSGAPKKTEESKIITLSDIIRTRRAQRMKAQSA